MAAEYAPQAGIPAGVRPLLEIDFSDREKAARGADFFNGLLVPLSFPLGFLKPSHSKMAPLP